MVDQPGIERRQFVASLLESHPEALVVTGLGSPTYDVHASGDRDNYFYLWGAMGSAALMGLGLALAQPGKNVLVITGDGEQLMGTGGLATIGVQNPDNLSVVVLDNGHFGETGMQRSHTSLGVDLVGIAKSCGIPNVHHVWTDDDADTLNNAIFSDKGSSFYKVHIRAENLKRSIPTLDGHFLKTRLRSKLGL